ncbi:MAG: glycosyl hydrolase [Campylobacterota bacterium]
MRDNPFIWDSHSDQPYPIADKKYKKSMYKKGAFDMVKTAVTSVLTAPLIALRYLTLGKQRNGEDIFGMCVNLDKIPQETPALIDDLGVHKIALRLPLADMDNLQRYLEFVKSLQGRHITLVILQDRSHIEDTRLCRKHADTVADTFAPYIDAVQIGNAINRKKWGFASMSEYLRFYNIFAKAFASFKNIDLIGSSTIDFEFHYTIRTLFNGFKTRYDKVASLLYVDRRGAPENSQMGFDFFKKLRLLYAIISLSPSKNSLIVSELNWPLSNTAPYAPTSEYECVDEEHYRNYMVRSYLLGLCSGVVDTIYWHQLAASGYGLIDLREGVRKRDAYQAYKVMVSLLRDAYLQEYTLGEINSAFFVKDYQTIEVYWARQKSGRFVQGELYDVLGNPRGRYEVDEAPIYQVKRMSS